MASRFERCIQMWNYREYIHKETVNKMDDSTMNSSIFLGNATVGQMSSSSSCKDSNTWTHEYSGSDIKMEHVGKLFKNDMCRNGDNQYVVLWNWILHMHNEITSSRMWESRCICFGMRNKLQETSRSDVCKACIYIYIYISFRLGETLIF